MDNEFYTLLTDRGMAKIANALADKKQLHLQKMAVGDSGGQYYEPTVSQTKLRHEVWRGDLNTLTVAPNNPNWLIAELVLPENIGGWYVREVGVFDTDGELIAIGKFPESYKPLLPGGSGKQVCIRLIMEVSNTTAVTLTVDPSIVLATRDYVDSQLDEHERSTNHPDATLTQKGFTQLSNATDSDDETKAATPKAVKAAMIEARNHRHTWSQITDIPDGTLTQKGIVKLNNATDSNSTWAGCCPRWRARRRSDPRAPGRRFRSLRAGIFLAWLARTENGLNARLYAVCRCWPVPARRASALALRRANRRESTLCYSESAHLHRNDQ